MPKSMMRAHRRHIRAKLVRRARRIYPEASTPQKLADNLKLCSCWMCRNRRAAEGPTLLERKILAAAPSAIEVQDDLDDVRWAPYDIALDLD